MPRLWEGKIKEAMVKRGLFDSTYTLSDNSFNIISDNDGLTSVFNKLDNYDKLCLDIETTSLRPHSFNAKIIGIGLTGDGNNIYYIDLTKFDKNFYSQFNAFIKNKLIIGQGLKFDIKFLLHNDVECKDIFFDTLVASQIIEPEKDGHALDELVARHIPSVDSGWKKRFKNMMKNRNGDIRSMPVVVIADYCCKDTKYTYDLYRILFKKAAKNSLLTLLNTLEFPLVKVLADMELGGICIDQEYLFSLKQKYFNELIKLEKEIYKEAGERFDVSSSQQLANILIKNFNINLPMTDNINTKNYSTDEKVLEGLRKKHKIIDYILSYREYAKLLSTYVNGLFDRIDADGRIRSDFIQNEARTHRFSSKNPNFQNIPVRKTGEIRNAFVAPIGYSLLSKDYSQIEIRVAAWCSGDKTLISTLNSSDVYIEMAKIFMNKQEISKKEREDTKTIVLGTIYGMGDEKFAYSLNITLDDARNIKKDFFGKFKQLKEAIRKTSDEVRKTGYVQFWSGKRLPLDQEYAFKAFNTRVQGTAADIMKSALVQCYSTIKKNSLSSKLLSTIHDELLFEGKDEEVESDNNFLTSAMTNCVIPDFNVPILVNDTIMKRWVK